MEMLDPLAFLWKAPKLLHRRRVNLYSDKDTSPNTLIVGDCADPFLAAMIKAFWKLAERLQLDIWIGTAGSTVNPADLPTRGERSTTQPNVAFALNSYPLLLMTKSLPR